MLRKNYIQYHIPSNLKYIEREEKLSTHLELVFHHAQATLPY